MVLHVEGDGGAGVAAAGADRSAWSLGQLLVEVLPERGELDADLGRRRQLGSGQRGQQAHVLVAGVLGLVGGERVLAEVVERDREPVPVSSRVTRRASAAA